MINLKGVAKAVSRSATHTMQKYNEQSITLLTGLGVEGDAHMGATVKHRSRVAADPTQPNLRQVHLIHAELHEELKSKGFEILPGQMGENITTEGIPLLDLPRNTRLYIGETAIIEVKGLRNPCTQLDGIQEGLKKAVIDVDEKGQLVRRAGVMGIVIQGGVIHAGDEIVAELPEKPYEMLEKV
jgi:MOSC domain-containing protein YiiM